MRKVRILLAEDQKDLNQLLTRRLKNIPILSMTLDGQDATAGMETRIESFIDILHLRKDGTVCL